MNANEREWGKDMADDSADIKAELVEERKRRESLEQRVNELVAENQRTRAAAGEAGDRSSGVADATWILKRRNQEKYGSNNFDKCSERDCEAGGGGCAAGSDGEPCHGQLGQSRL